jgi:hypothetical protein
MYTYAHLNETNDSVLDYPLSIYQVRSLLTNVSFPDNPSFSQLLDLHIVKVIEVEKPDPSSLSYEVIEATPVKNEIDGLWYQTWTEIANTTSLDEYKSEKITELALYAKSLIESGFQSDATGEYRHYDGTLEDQVNITGAASVALSTGGFVFPSRDIATMTKSYSYHTDEQMSKVASDGAAWKLSKLIRFNALKSHVMSLSTRDSIVAVDWNTEI